MYRYKDVKVLHLEITERCQAGCPQCGRTGVDITNSELSLDDCKKYIPPNFVKQLKAIFMCGTFGDPMIARDTLEVFRYFRKHNPKINLRMTTNGGARDAQWWRDIAEVVDIVEFSIDGLKNTNHMYRKNVVWENVENNIKTFIGAGGTAQWTYLIFPWNEHEVDSAEQWAEQLGFSKFVRKITTRGKELPKVPKGIECKVQKEKSLYLSAEGKFMPCCWIGSQRYRKEWIDWPSEFDQKRFDEVENSWQNDPLPVCSRKCSIYYKPFEEQFVGRKDFNVQV